MKVPEPEPYQPSQLEILAQRQAENAKIESIQDRLQGETDRLFRIYGARRALSGLGSSLGKVI